MRFKWCCHRNLLLKFQVKLYFENIFLFCRNMMLSQSRRKFYWSLTSSQLLLYRLILHVMSQKGFTRINKSKSFKMTMINFKNRWKQMPYFWKIPTIRWCWTYNISIIRRIAIGMLMLLCYMPRLFRKSQLRAALCLLHGIIVRSLCKNGVTVSRFLIICRCRHVLYQQTMFRNPNNVVYMPP